MRTESSNLVWPSLALVILFVSGCANVPDCDPGASDPIDRAFAPLDNAVGAVNEDLNDQSGDCRMMTSSEAEGYPSVSNEGTK
jgi:hypothetical protein